MPNLYTNIGEFQRRFLNGQTLDTNDTIEALALIEAASRAIDGITRRKFYAETVTRYLRGTGTLELELPDDWASFTTVAVDEDGDRTYETTLVANTDYETANMDPDHDADPPWGVLRILDGGAISAWPTGVRSVKLVGRRGYSDNVSAVLTSAGAAVTGTLADATDTTLATSAVASPALAPGMKIRIGSEDIYILSGATASPFNVQRGVNGTTAAAHTSAAISTYVYEPDVVQATMIQVGRLWTRRNAPMLPVIAAPGLGDIQLAAFGLDPDVAQMVARLKRFRSL